MNRFGKPLAIAGCFVVLMCAGDAPESPIRLSVFNEAHAIIGVAPGGSVVRRRAIAGTAVVASSTANANAAAKANADAAAAAKTTAAAAPAGPPPVGSTVTVLPPGCTPTKLNGVDYQRCGSTYYAVAFQGSAVVFVVSQP